MPPTKRCRLAPFPWAADYARPHPPPPTGDILVQNVTVGPGSDAPHAMAALGGETRAPFVEVFGVTAEGATACVRVHGFRPYFYVRLEEDVLTGVGAREQAALAERVRRRLEGLGCGRVLLVEPERARCIYGWQGQEHWFWKVTPLLPQTVGELRRHLHRSPLDGTDAGGAGALGAPEFGACRTTYENNVKYNVRAIVDRGWGGMAWARLPAGRWEHRRARTATTDLEVDVRFRDLEPVEPPAAAAPLRVLSFDIETESPTERYATPQLDPVGCVSCAAWEREPGGTWRKLRTVTFTWHRPEVPPEEAGRQHVWYTRTEAEMLLYFAAFVRLWDPDFVTGHNTGHYDWSYLVARIRALGLEAYDMGDGTTCLHLGRRTDREIRLEHKQMMRMGRMDDYILVRAPGRVAEYDHLPLAQTNVAKSYDSYKLGDVAQKELGYGKEDVSYDKITPMLHGTPADVWTVLRYCQRDAELPWLLCMVNNYLEGHEAMARLVRVPLVMLVDSGQQVRTQAIMLERMQAARRAGRRPFLIPYIEPAPAKKGREKGYEGAFVIPPRRGYYRCDDLQPARPLLEAELRGRPRLAPDEPDNSTLDYNEPEGELPPRLLRARGLLAGEATEEELEACLPRNIRRARARKRARQQSPVATLDFASLYPSIMLANNLCYSTHVPAARLAAARAAGLPLRRMPNGEWFVQAWRPVRPDAPAPAGADLWEKEEVVLVEDEAHERALLAEGFAVAEEDWHERFENFGPVGRPGRRRIARRVCPHWRDDRLVGVLPALLIDLLAARKTAKRSMAAAGKRAKLLRDARALNALLVRAGHADDTPEAEARAAEALKLLWGERRHRAFLRDVAGGARLAGTRPAVLLRVMRWLRGDAVTERRWHDLRPALLEVYAGAMDALREAYPEAPWEEGGVQDLAEGPLAAWAASETTRWERQHAADDARQMALKVVCNSVYGFTGATKGKLPCLAISSAVTAVGRAMLQQTIDICTERLDAGWGGCSPYPVRCVYGDSVTGDTPVVVRDRRTGEIETRRIDRLVSDRAWGRWHDTKWAADGGDWDVWTERGWTAVRRVIHHRVPAAKRILEVTTPTGCVRVTDEHSLLRPGATPETERIDAKDVVPGQQIVHADLPVPPTREPVSLDEARSMGMRVLEKGGGVPAHILNAQPEARRVFLDAYRGDGGLPPPGLPRVDVQGQETAAGMYLLMESLGHAVRVDPPTRSADVYRVRAVRQPPAEADTITQVREVPHDGCVVYDLETENHHFQAGVGRIVVHNTDSVFLEFVGCPTMAEAFELAEQMAERCTRSFHSPFVKLELEKIFRRILLMKRKRYEGEKDERAPSGLTGPDGRPIYDVTTSGMSKGSETRRRDACAYVRDTIVRAVRLVFSDDDLDGAIEYVRGAVHRLAAGDVPYEQLVLSRSVSKHPDDYVVKQAHIALLQRMLARDAGRTFEIGSRVHYILTRAHRKAKTAEMAEDPAYAAAHRIPYNADYYIGKQLMKPLVRFFGPFLSGPDVPQKACDEHARRTLFGDLFVRLVRLGGIRDGFMADWVATAAPDDDEAHEARMLEMREFLPGYEPDTSRPVFGPAPPAAPLEASTPAESSAAPPAKRARLQQAGLDGWLARPDLAS